MNAASMSFRWMWRIEKGWIRRQIFSPVCCIHTLLWFGTIKVQITWVSTLPWKHPAGHPTPASTPAKVSHLIRPPFSKHTLRQPTVSNWSTFHNQYHIAIGRSNLGLDNCNLATFSPSLTHRASQSSPLVRGGPAGKAQSWNIGKYLGRGSPWKIYKFMDIVHKGDNWNCGTEGLY